MKIKRWLQLAVLCPLLLSVSNGVSAVPDLQLVKKRVVEALMQHRVNDDRIGSLVDSFRQDGTWPGINYEDVTTTGFEHRIHCANMVSLARAYKTKSSKFYRKKQVRETIVKALAYWVQNDFICDNWWYNQIGTPNSLVTLMLLMEGELPRDLVQRTQPIIGRANLNASGARPGGDRIRIASILAKNLLFLNDEQQFAEVIEVIEGEIKFVPWIGAQYGYTFRLIRGGLGTEEASGRGMQYDYSFHHRIDGVNNTLSYGLGYAEAFVEWAGYTTGTRYSFSEVKMELLTDYFLDGICKTSVFGKYPDFGAKNRSISRRGALRPYRDGMAEKLLQTTDYRKDELQEIADIRHKGIKPTLAHATFYWDSEHFTFQRPGFFTSVRMYSTRNHNMEQPYNREGLFNHYRGDGTNHISRTGDEYYDIAPVFDYQKVPGATIMQRPVMPPEDEIQKLGLTDFVGAVTDGKFGAAAFDFKSPHDPLCARKAWFFFDDEYVCLGSGISCSKQLPVVTTLNQCLLRDEVTVSKEGKKLVMARGEKHLEGVDWVFQDGIGYVFPEPTAVNIMNDQASGSWYAISKQTDSPKDEITMDVFKLWIDHGERPSDEAYVYMVVPATTVEGLEANTSGNNVRILSNTPELQAVKHAGLQMCQAVFYKAGNVQLTNRLKLTCHGPGIVLVKMEGANITQISVSDPNRELCEIHLSVTGRMEKTGKDFRAVWNEEKGLTEIAIDLPQGHYAGKSVTINL